MVRKVVMAAALAASTLTVAMPTAAYAQHGGRGGWQDENRDYRGSYDRGDDDRNHRDRGRWDGDRRDHNYQRGYSDRGYGRGGYYAGNDYGRPGYRARGYNRSDRQRCNDGTTGTIIGAIAGGLVGNSVAGHGDRTLGAILGGGAGALAGRAIDKSSSPSTPC